MTAAVLAVAFLIVFVCGAVCGAYLRQVADDRDRSP